MSSCQNSYQPDYLGEDEAGNQWPMLVAGGLSTLVGLFYIGQALGDDPQLAVLSVYAAGGGAFFVIQSALLLRRERRAVRLAHAA